MWRQYIGLPRRNVDGILLMDKPKNVASSFLLNKVKTLFHASKAGHTGTLDMLATGMLPICFGKATKLAKYLLNSDKKYQVIAKLGVSTDTFDAYGKIIRVVPVVKIIEYELKKCLECFKGKSYQIPPMFSAIKYCGVPLYKYARRNIDISRRAREIFIYSLRLIAIRVDIIELIVHCSKGTYIRSVIHDLGECLGCGAHIIELRRLTVGKCTSGSMINIKTLETIFYDSFLNDIEVLDVLDALLISTDMIKKLY